MTQKVLIQCGLYKLLHNRRTSLSAQSYAGKLVMVEANIAGVLEYIKTNFPNFTEHGIQHSLRILRYYADTNKVLEHASPRTWNVVEKVSVLYNQTTGTLIISDYGTGMDENEIRRYLFKAADSGYK